MPDREEEHHDASDLREQAEAAFVEFMSLTQAGEGTNFDTFCADRPDLASELRSLYEDWQRIRKLVGRSLPPTLSDQLSQVHGIDLESGVALDPVSRPSSAVLERLGEHTPQAPRYEVVDEIARGGMGVILKTWDKNLRRNLAMKALISDHQRAKTKDRTLARFLEEAQITGQLGHPGIVPVHDLGLDAEGHVFFTMPLVHGRDFKDAIKLTRDGREGWTRTRALRVIMKVCEAVAYAHSRGVIHRDIKPANVMVGRFGETYVMDWGLARVMGRQDSHDIRVRPDAGTTVIETDLRDARESGQDSPLFTMDGAVIGTPSYMSPEQASGMIDDLDGRTDVYAIGAMLYHLLSHQMPYCPKGAFVSPRTVLTARLNGAPPPIADLNPEAPAALIEICEKAMADEPDQRYETPLQLSEDIERYLSDRPVSVHEATLGYQLALAYRRNRTIVNTVAFGLAILLGFAGLFYLERRRAQQRANDVLSARALPLQVDELFPALPPSEPAITAWLGRVDDLLTRRAGWQAEGEGLGEAPVVLAAMDRLSELRPDVARRLALARTFRDPAFLDRSRLWNEAIEAISTAPLYGGLRLEPIDALVPLGRDPNSGLFEFWNPLTGERPVRDPEAQLLEPGLADGLVLVLLPGGTYEMGSPPDEIDRVANEPLHEVTLEPFFLSKYEVTQAQWERVMGDNPSTYAAGLVLPEKISRLHPGLEITALHPVESVSWHQAREYARRVAMTLPTEEQWEYADRAGETSAWHWGETIASLEGNANLPDRSAAAFGTWVDWDDGFPAHSPIGAFGANAFGLHDTTGNVSEWCDTWYENDWTGEETRRIYRGGSYVHRPTWARSAFRGFDVPIVVNLSRGIRVSCPVRRGSSNGS
jgi:formylglycine-generating enzyme required for sulfatase activity/serine/threonine protein kinase